MFLVDIIDTCSSVIIYRDAVSHQFYNGEENYSTIINSWHDMTSDALEMPAYCVSIDNLTREQMAEGNWVEFIFDGVCEFNSMSFEKLLVKVEDNYCGFNLIRYNSDDGYSGRCFYLQLNGGNMSNFNIVLKNIAI